MENSIQNASNETKEIVPSKRILPSQKVQKVQLFQSNNQANLPDTAKLFRARVVTNEEVQHPQQPCFPDPSKKQLLMAMLKSNNDFQGLFFEVIKDLQE